MLTLIRTLSVVAGSDADRAPAASPADLLWRLAAVLAAVAGVTATAGLVDDRQLGTYGVWTKPLKFQLALAVQSATLAWGVRQLRASLQNIALPAWLARVWVAVVVYEAAYITLQGARGAASHFNRGTPWESVAGSLMAAGAGVLVSVTMWIGAVALWQAWRERDAGVAPAVVSSSSGSPAAAASGVLMPLAIGAGFVLGGLLAGWSGSAMGAARGYWPQPLVEPVTWMLVTGWVLSQPDLRIAHFVGLHQMQLLPAIVALAAWAGWRRGTTLAVLAAASLGAVLAVRLLVQP